MAEAMLQCRYCGELCDPSEMCDYRGLLLCDGCADTDTPEVVAEIVRLREGIAAALALSQDEYLASLVGWREIAARMRAALSPQSGNLTDIPRGVAGSALEGPQGPKSTNCPVAPIAGATGDSGANTQGGR